MSDMLRKLGIWSFNHRWRVLFGWVAILAVVLVLMLQFSKPLSTSISIPGTEAQATLDKLSKQLPAASSGSGTVVFAVPKGQTLASHQAAIEQSLQKIAAEKDVANVVSPFKSGTISADGRIALASVQLKVTSSDVSSSLPTNVQNDLSTAKNNGVEAEVRGDFVPKASEGSSEAAGIAIAAIVLFITLGSLVAAGMPLIVAFLSVGLGMLGINALSGVFTISSVAPTLATMLGLAVGIDYSLFIITKYRKYLLEGLEPQFAVGRATSTAGNAVVFAALTVVIALSALSVTGIPFLTVMGLAAAGTVAVAAVIAITLIPALLGFAKLKILNKKTRAALLQGASEDTNKEQKQTRQTLGYRWASKIAKYPVVAIIAVVLLLGAAALPLTKLNLGFASDGNAAANTTERKAYDLTSEGFGIGTNGPLLVVADLPAGLTPVQVQTHMAQIAAKLQNLPDAAHVLPAGASKDLRTAIFQVIPKTGPNDEATKQLVANIRSQSKTTAVSGSSLAVTGSTALSIDVENKLTHVLPLYIIVVLGLSLIILVTVFRSIVIPIKATLGFLLTIAATFGALVAFFQWGWFGLFTTTPIISFLPIIVTGILFGLAMDYEFFLVSGMQEAYNLDKSKDAKAAVLSGVGQGAKVVSAAAVIMIAVFAGFIASPDSTTKTIGFALAFGVFVDAFLVRMTLVPAVMSLAGRAAWWLPKWLDKLLPHISIEGATEEHLEQKEDLDQMERAELMLALGNDMLNINRRTRLDNKATVALSPVLDNALLTVGLETEVTTQYLAQILGVAVGPATKYVNELEEHGYVQVVKSSSESLSSLELTAKGVKTYRTILHNKSHDMRAFMQPLTDDDVRALVKVVRKLKNSLE